MGPFHFFFTLSAAEMLWPEVTTAILHYEQEIEKIVYEVGWETDEEKIMIYSKGWETKEKDSILPLPIYKETKLKNKHKMYKDHFLLITRIFDNRVKAFINNILMANENVEHYSYRIGKCIFSLLSVNGYTGH